MNKYPNGPGFANGSTSSKDGARMIEPHCSRLQWLIYGLCNRSLDGYTAEQLADLTGLGTSSVTARIRELHNKGWLRAGPARRLARSGVYVRVNVAVPQQLHLSL